MSENKKPQIAAISKGSYIYVDGFRIQILEDTSVKLDQEIIDRFLKEESDQWHVMAWKNKVCCPRYPYGKS